MRKNRTWANSVGMVTLALLAAGVMAPTQAVDMTWIGNNSSSFTDPLNWSGGAPGAIPGTADYAVFTTHGTYDPVLNSDLPITGTKFTTGGWTLSGTGKLTTTDWTWLAQNGGTNTFTLPMGGGNYVAEKNAHIYLSGSVGTMNLRANASYWGVSSTFTIDGTTSNTATSFTVEDVPVELNKTGGAYALNITASASVKGPASVRWLADNQNQVAGHWWVTGTLDLNGHSDQFATFRFLNNTSTNPTINTGGGTMTVKSGAWSMSQAITVGEQGALAKTALVTGGGKMMLQDSTGFWVAAHGSDPSGIDLDINVPIGIISGVAAVKIGTNAGGGVVCIRSAADASYTVPTEIDNNHTLLVANASGSAVGTGNLTVRSTGTLGGNGFIALAPGNSVTNYGKIAPGMSIGTLTVSGDVIFKSGSTFDVQYNATTSDLLAVSGALDISGATLNLIDLSGGTPASLYTFATYGTLTGTFAAVTGTMPSGMQLVYNGGAIRLADIPEPASLSLLFIGALALGRRRV